MWPEEFILESMSSLQLSLAAIGALTVGAVLVYNYWTSRKNAPRQADPHRDPVLESALHAIEPVLNTDPGVPAGSTDAIEPVLQDAFTHLSQPDRKPQLDALIDVLAPIEVDQVVSGDAALAALPSTRRVGTKLFCVEGLVQGTGQWEALAAGRRYNAFQAGVQLANRVGAINNIEFSEFVIKTQAFADAIGGSASFSDMLDEVAAQDLAQVGQPPLLSALQPLSPARQANVLRHWLKGLGVRASHAQLQALMQQVQACTTRGHHIHLKIGEGFVHRVQDRIDWYNP